MRYRIFTLCLWLAFTARLFAQQLDCPGAVVVQAGQSGATSAHCQPTPTPRPTPTPTPVPIPAPAPIPTPTPRIVGQEVTPSNLAQFLRASGAPAGTVLLLRGGDYRGPFVLDASGLTVRTYPGEHPRLTCGPDQTQNVLTINGANNTVQGLEFSCEGADRTRPIGTGVVVYGPQAKIVNNYIHDAGIGIAAWTPALDVEIYGNIIARNGWQGAGPDRGHGHGIYSQNDVGTKRILDNIILDQFGWGLHVYTEGGTIKGFQVEGNTLFNNGSSSREKTHPNILIGGAKPAERIVVTSNYTYQTSNDYNVQLPYGGAANADLTLTGNYFAGGITDLGQNWQRVAASGNVITGQFRQPAQTPAGWTLADNSVSPTASRNEVFVRPNKYEEGRASIIVYNWTKAASVSVDLSGLLKAGDRFEIVNVQQYSNIAISGIYAGAAISLPVAGEFGCFIVRKAQ